MRFRLLAVALTAASLASPVQASEDGSHLAALGDCATAVWLFTHSDCEDSAPIRGGKASSAGVTVCDELSCTDKPSWIRTVQIPEGFCVIHDQISYFYGFQDFPGLGARWIRRPEANRGVWTLVVPDTDPLRSCLERTTGYADFSLRFERKEPAHGEIEQWIMLADDADFPKHVASTAKVTPNAVKLRLKRNRVHARRDSHAELATCGHTLERDIEAGWVLLEKGETHVSRKDRWGVYLERARASCSKLKELPAARKALEKMEEISSNGDFGFGRRVRLHQFPPS